MIFKNLLIKKQKFREVDDKGINVFLANIEALCCIEQVTKLLLDHKSQQTYVYNYDPSLFYLMGSERNSLSEDIIEQLRAIEDLPIINKYCEVINKYFTDKTNEFDRTFFFSIDFVCNIGADDPFSLCIKVLPYLYTSNKKLQASLCFFELSNYTGKPKLKLHNVKDQRVLVYSTVTGHFIDQQRTELSLLEIEILRRSGEGEKEQFMAESLELTLGNLKRIKASIFEKLKVRSISEAIFVAYKQGLFKSKN
ncbi:MAG: hypothetical protein ACRDCS_05260 [Tannerellaceae bacterium]